MKLMTTSPKRSTLLGAALVLGLSSLALTGCGGSDDSSTGGMTAPSAPAVTGISPTSGMTGTSVTITGTNFTGVTSVKFGAVSATSFKVISTTQITAVAPAGTGVKDVTVVEANGTSAAVATDHFSYSTPPAPAVGSLSPTSGSVAGGTVVTVTGSGFTTGATIKFGTVAGTSVTVVDSMHITVKSPAEAAGTVDVTVTDANGTSTISTADKFQFTAAVQSYAYKATFGLGMGTGNGQLGGVYGVALDAAGDVYVADDVNDRVEVFNPNGTFKATIGTSGSQAGQLSSPLDVVLDAAGDIYVADDGNNRVDVFNPNGSYKATIGNTSSGASAGSGNGQFDRPEGVALDAAGDLFVADTENNRVQEFTSNGTFKAIFGSGGNGSSGNGQLNQPNGVVVDAAGDVYVSDTGNSRVEVFNSNGTFKTVFGTSQLVNPIGIALDSSGNVYVANYGANDVVVFASDGTFKATIGTSGHGNGQLTRPSGVRLDSSGNVYVADLGNARVEEFGPGK